MWSADNMENISSDEARLLRLAKRSAQDGYEKMDDIYDALLMLMAVRIMEIPVFYQGNMVILRRSFLEKLLAGSQGNKAVRAGIYIFLALLVLRAPVIRSRMQKQSGDALTGIMLDDLQETDKGIGRDDFTQIFPLERNTFSLGMKLLGDKLQLVNKLTDGSYGFAIQPVAKATDFSLEEAALHLESFSAVLKAMRQSDVLTGILLEGDDAAQAEFASDEEGISIVSSVLADCGIPRWQAEIMEVIRQQGDNPAHPAVARKLLELADDTPFVSANGSDFCLLRQDLLEYVVLLGYDGNPVLSSLAEAGRHSLSKAAMVVLLFLFIMADEEGYACKVRQGQGEIAQRDLLQLKDIAIACHISIPTVSKAIKQLAQAGVIERTVFAGSRGYRFSNRLPTLHGR